MTCRTVAVISLLYIYLTPLSHASLLPQTYLNNVVALGNDQSRIRRH
jgi:hypothetical protein